MLFLKFPIFALDMKTVILKYIFTYLSVAYFLVGGTGFNVVNYGCQSCKNEGIEMVAADSCFAIHHNVRPTSLEKQHSDLYCADINKHLEDCQFMRLNTDIPSFQGMNKLLIEQINMVYLFNTLYNFFTEKTELSNPIGIPTSENYLSMSGRSILTFHAVLII